MVRRNQKSESRKQKCVARAFLLSAFCLLLSAAAAASSLSVDKRTLALDALATSGGGAAKQKTVAIPIDRYQWPLGAAFVLLLLGSIANRGAE